MAVPTREEQTRAPGTRPMRGQAPKGPSPLGASNQRQLYRGSTGLQQQADVLRRWQAMLKVDPDESPLV